MPDLRNSKAAELILTLADRGFALGVHDPLADPAEARSALRPAAAGRACRPRAPTTPCSPPCRTAPTARLDAAALARLLRPGGLLADLKGLWRHLELPPDRPPLDAVDLPGRLPRRVAKPAVGVEPALQPAFGQQIVEMRQALAERELQLMACRAAG